MEDLLIHEVSRGALVLVERVESKASPGVAPTERAPTEQEYAPPPPPAEDLRSFELLVVDEIGEPVAHADVRFEIHGVTRYETTDADGNVRIDGVSARGARATLASYAAIDAIMSPRWSTERDGTLPDHDSSTSVPFFDPLPSVTVAADVPHRLVLLPPSCVEISLLDALQLPVANEPYEVRTAWGQIFAGSLDQQGYARVDGVRPGNCSVTFPRLHRTDWSRLSA